MCFWPFGVLIFLPRFPVTCLAPCVPFACDFEPTQVREASPRLAAARWVLLAMSICWGATAVVNGQDFGGPSQLVVPEKTPDVLSPGVKADAVLLRNDMGQNILIPLSRYEDFEQFLNEGGAGTTVASDALEQLSLVVAIEESSVGPSVAKLAIEANAKLDRANSGWLGIPIGLDAVQVVPSMDTAGEATFPPIRAGLDRAGYIWRVSPANELTRSLKFNAVASVRRYSQSQSLRLDLPMTTVTLRIELSQGSWELVANGTGYEVIEPFVEIGGRSVAIVRCSGGPLVLTWSKKSNLDQIAAMELESQTKYTAQSEPGVFRAVSNLAIRGPKALGGRRYLLSLPEKSQWREPVASTLGFPGYRLSRATAPGDIKTTLLLEVDEDVSRTELEIAIEWQTSYGVDLSQLAFSMLQAEGLQRHFGTIELSVPRSVRFSWDPQPSFQFLRQSPANDGSDALNYIFGFDQQTTPLVVKWTNGDRVSDLRSSYSVQLDENEVRLTGTIELLGDIRLFPFLQLEALGWSVERVQLQPSGRDLDLIATRNRTPVEKNGKTLELSSIILSLGELLDATQSSNSSVSSGLRNRVSTETVPAPTDETPAAKGSPTREENGRPQPRSISFLLVRSLDKLPELSSREVEFALPMISWLDPGSQQRLSLSIAGELNVQSKTSRLVPSAGLSDAIKLVPDSVGVPLASSSNPERNVANTPRTQWKYRLLNAKSWIEWKGNSESMGSSVRASAKTEIKLNDAGRSVLQTWKLSFDNALPGSLRIAIPKDWIEPELSATNTQFRYGGEPLTVEWVESLGEVPWPSSSLTKNRYAWARVTLSGGSKKTDPMGAETLTVSRKWDRSDLLPGSVHAFDWLLPWIAVDKPQDSLVLEQYKGEILCADGFECTLISPFDREKESPERDGAGRASIAFDRSQSEPRLEGQLRVASEKSESEIDIEAVWLQTIFNAVEQRDRFVIRFKTMGDKISFQLPGDRVANGEFLVDGHRVSATRNPTDPTRFEVNLLPTPSKENASQVRAHVLEVFLWPPSSMQWIKSKDVRGPIILDAKNRAPFVWHIMVPSTIHLVGSSSSLSAGYRWRWQDLWFGRKGDWNQEEIAKEMGASVQPLVSNHMNEYVFFSLDHTVSMKVWMVPRYLLWAPIALCVLLGSFAMMEFRWIRNPTLGVLLLVSSLAFSQWAWDLTVAIVQCSVVAAGIAVLCSGMKWVLDRRSRRRSVFATRPIASPVPSAVRSTALASPASGAIDRAEAIDNLSPASDASERNGKGPQPSTTNSAEAERGSG